MDYTGYDFIGNLGVALILIAFFGLQTQRLSSQDPKYSWLNLIGALAIVVSLTHTFNLSSFIIEIFWIAFSVIGLVNHYRQKTTLQDSGEA